MSKNKKSKNGETNLARYQSGYTQFGLHSCQEDLYVMIIFFTLSKLIKLAIIVLVDLFSMVLGMELRALRMLHNGSITEIHPQLMVVFYEKFVFIIIIYKHLNENNATVDIII